MWLMDWVKLLAHIVECFLFFYGPDDICLQSRRLCCLIGSCDVQPQTTCFKYLGIFFDAGFWELPCAICAAMPPKMNLLKSVASVSWGAHLSCLILLYEGLIGSVLEYGSVCFTNMAKTHMLGLERVQYRALRIASGVMGFTPNNCLGFLSGGFTTGEKIHILEFQIPCCCFWAFL
jgi:hypothetical protein